MSGYRCGCGEWVRSMVPHSCAAPEQPLDAAIQRLGIPPDPVLDGKPLGEDERESGSERRKLIDRIVSALCGGTMGYDGQIAYDLRQVLYAELPAAPSLKAEPQQGSGEDTYTGACPQCGSSKWISVSLNEGYTRIPQCVPCGAYHRHTLGPGWRALHEQRGREIREEKKSRGEL